MQAASRYLYIVLGVLGLALWGGLHNPGLACEERRSLPVYPEVEQTDSAILKPEDKLQIQEFLRIKNRIGFHIWPGFGESEIPLLLYNRDYEFLILHPAPPPDWERVRGDTYQGLPYFMKESVHSEAFAIRIGSLWAASLNTLNHMNTTLKKQVYEKIEPEKITPALLEMFKFTPSQHVLALLHEAFHAYQAMCFSERFQAALGSYTDKRDYPYANQDFKEAWDREGYFLWEALREKENQKMRVAVEGFLDVRSQRRKDHRIDRSLISFEQELEWLEGLAKYTEMRGAELGSEEKFAQNFKEYRVARGRLRADFYTRLRGLGDQKGDLRFYLSGAAQALLLDRLNPEWKTEIAEDQSLALERLLESKR